MTDRSKTLEVMAKAAYYAAPKKFLSGTVHWSELANTYPHEHRQWLTRAEAALAAYESHLQAEGMAVVPGWQPIESAPMGRKLIVAYRNRLGHWRQVMACYFERGALDSDETEDGFAPEGWYEESDTQENLLRTDEPPTFWRPLLPFPDDGKADRPEVSAEAQSAVAHSPYGKAVVKEKDDE